MVTKEATQTLQSFFQGTSGLIPTLLVFTLVIVAYSVFVYYFYRFLARKNIIELNLNRYNHYSNPGFVKFFAVIFYIIEYVILLPIFTFIWFGFLSILILVLAEGIGINLSLLISASLVAGVRVTSYISENLSKDLAKMLPFTLLAVVITKPGFFVVSSLIERISEIPLLFSQIPYYLVFIITIELIMRVADIFTGGINPFRNSEEEIEE